MFPHTKKRKAISVVLTTMIILVASVVLGTGVVIYGTSLFQTNAGSQNLSIQNVSLWVNATNATGTSWGAAAIRNTGDKLESLDTIQVRGIEIAPSSWYVANQTNSLANIQDAFVYGTNWTNGTLKTFLGPTGFPASTNTCTSAASHTIKMDIDGLGGKPMLCMNPAAGPLSLKPGDSAVIYFQVPAGVLRTVDSGVSSSVAIYAGNIGAPSTVTIANP